MKTNPWRRLWVVGFASHETSRFMRLFYRARPGFQHVWAVSPVGDAEQNWIFADWTLMGGSYTIISRQRAEQLFLSISKDGGMLTYEVKNLPKRAISRAVVPTSCAGYIRELLALPATWAFWHSPASLWCELRKAGAEVTFMPINEPRW